MIKIFRNPYNEISKHQNPESAFFHRYFRKNRLFVFTALSDGIKYDFECPETEYRSAVLNINGKEISAVCDSTDVYIDNFKIISLLMPNCLFFKIWDTLVLLKNGQFIFITLKNNLLRLEDIVLNLEGATGFYIKEKIFINDVLHVQIHRENLKIHFNGKIFDGYMKNGVCYLKHSHLKGFITLLNGEAAIMLRNKIIVGLKNVKVIALPAYELLNIGQLLFEAMGSVEYAVGARWDNNICITRKSCLNYATDKYKKHKYENFGEILLDKPLIDGVETVVYLNGKKSRGSYIYTDKKTKITGKPERYFKKFQYVEDAIAFHKHEEYIGSWFDKNENIYYITINNKMSKAPVMLIRRGSRVDIHVNFNFCGGCFCDEFEDKGETYEQVAVNGIIDIWQGRYFENVPYDLFGMDYVDVIVHINRDKTKKVINFYINKRGRGFAPYNIGWNIGGSILNRVYCYAFQKSVYFSYHRFAQLAAHEFGHLIGLGDAYHDIWQKAAPINPETPEKFIMRDNSDKVTSNDIEMVLEAFKTNGLQRYTDYYFLFDKSKSVRYSETSLKQ